MASRKKKRGHWCWCCQRSLPNERFSGGGHARHLCKECARLPSEERDYRQAVADIDRIYFGPGRFRKKRPELEKFLDHPDARVRAHVDEILNPPEPVWDNDDEDDLSWL